MKEQKIITECIPNCQISEFEWLHIRKGELPSCKRGIAQGNSPYGLYCYKLQSALISIPIFIPTFNSSLFNL